MGKYNVNVSTKQDEIRSRALEAAISAASGDFLGKDTIQSGLDQPSQPAQPIQAPVPQDTAGLGPGALATEQELQDPALRQGRPQSAIDQQQMLEQQKQQRLAAQQRESERVPALTEISSEGATAWGDDTYDAFGTALTRADNFTTMFHDKLESGATVAGVWKGAKETADINPLGDITREQLTLKDVVFGPTLNAGMVNQNGQTQVSPEFGRVMGFVTEQLVGSDKIEENPFATEEEKAQTLDEEGGVARGGNVKLGMEIAKAWKRDQNYRNGRPTDDYDLSGMTPDDYELLGTAAKEMYSAANPEMYERITDPIQRKVQFKLTPLGADTIRKVKMATPDAFTNTEIPPTPAPRPVIEKFGGSGEGAGRRKFKTTAVKNRRLARVEEARNNMNSVAHVVDPLRRKIFWQYGLMVLSQINKGQALPEAADMFDIGPKKFQHFKGQAQIKKDKQEPGWQDYDPKKEFQNYVLKFLETMNTAARYSNQPNHLDFAVQELQTRMHVEQTRFNPQGNPWMRQITGGAEPSTFRVGGGSEAELMFKELMATFFLGGKVMTPAARVKAFNEDWKNPNGKLRGLVGFGQQIEENMLSPEEDKQATDLFSQIQMTDQGVVIPPALQNLKPGVTGPALTEAISHGKEGPLMLEAMHELAKYAKGGQFTSNIGVEIDGMTHGPATNMAQLGIARGAYRTGVLKGIDPDAKLGDFYMPTSGIIRTETFEAGPSSLKDTATRRDQEGFSTAWEDHLIATGQATRDDNLSGGYPAADYIDGQTGERIEVKSLAPGHKSGNFYMTEATLNNMRNKIENGLIDAVEVTTTTPLKGREVKVEVHGRIPAEEFLRLVDTNVSEDGIAKRFGYAAKVSDIANQAGDAQKAGDLRAGMKEYMMQHGQAHAENWSGNTEVAASMWRILQEAVKDRDNFLKKPPMTLGYGQLMKNLNGAVQTAVASGDASPAIQKIINEIRPFLENKARPNQTPTDVVVEFLHDILADSINAEMDPEVVQVGQLLRANNVIAMLSDEVITITNPLGYDTYIGAKQSTPQEHRAGLNITTPEGKKTGDVTLYQSAPSGSAVRDGKPGGWGRGRIIPAVIQGLDGAWMNKTFTGASWKDLKGGYLLPIMDAVKTDLATGRKAREHANKNWWNSIQEWSYVEEVMGNWAPDAVKRFRQKLMDMDPNVRIDLTQDNEFRGFAYLLDPAPDNSGKTPFNNLVGTVYDSFEFRSKQPGESVQKYEWAKKGAAKDLVQSMIIPNLYKSGKQIDSLSPEQALDFFDRMMAALKVSSRNQSTRARTKSRREQLFDRAKKAEITQIDIG